MSKKVAILGDCHVGAHASNADHHAYMAKFFVDFFNYLDDNGITDVIQLGDLFDVRKHVTTWSIRWFKKHVLEPIVKRNLNFYVLVGNHDIYYRETVDLSSTRELLDHISNIKIIDIPTDVKIADKTFLLVPWVCRENQSDVNKAIEYSDSDYCCGHFEFDGFELYKGQFAKTHHNHTDYKKFKQVFSGHYHHMSRKDNILYTGTPYELTWQDCNTPKGFFVLDKEPTMVYNEHIMYTRFAVSDLDAVDLGSAIPSKHVRITVDVDMKPKDRDALEDRVYNLKPLSVKYIDQVVDKETANTTQVVTSSSVTEIISDYVESITAPANIDKMSLTTILQKLHIEATTNAS